MLTSLRSIPVSRVPVTGQLQALFTGSDLRDLRLPATCTVTVHLQDRYITRIALNQQDME
jgi:hypothetical protein